MNTVLVTGGAGLIGVNVIRELVARGDRVVIYDSRPDLRFIRDLESSIVVVAGDILDLAFLIETMQAELVTHVIHLAAVMSKFHIRHPTMLSRINLEGTLNVFEAAKLCGVGRVVFGSTRGVMARSEGTPHGPPTYLPAPHSFTGPRHPLGILKLAAEQLGLSYARNGDLDFCAVRFADFYGAERIAKTDRAQATVFNDVILNAYYSRPTHLRQGADQPFEPLYVKDCASGVVAACFAGELQTRIYQIGLGYPVRFGDAIDFVRKKFPASEIEVGAGANFAYTESDPNYCILDTRPAQTEIGYTPRFSLERALDDYVETLDRYRKNGVIPEL